MAAKNKRTTNRTSRRATAFVTAPTATTTTPTREDIARRAFELYLDRGGEHGHDAEDWIRAESELRERIAS